MSSPVLSFVNHTSVIIEFEFTTEQWDRLNWDLNRRKEEEEWKRKLVNRSWKGKSPFISSSCTSCSGSCLFINKYHGSAMRVIAVVFLFRLIGRSARRVKWSHLDCNHKLIKINWIVAKQWNCWLTEEEVLEWIMQEIVANYNEIRTCYWIAWIMRPLLQEDNNIEQMR